MTTQDVFKDYDVIMNYLRGGPGFGDPLDRRPEDVENDLNERYILLRYAEKVYGCVFTEKDGKYHVNLKETEQRRQQIRNERLKRSVPTKDWMKHSRTQVENKEAALQVRHMYAESFALSEKFTDEFKAFWDLPEDWMIYEEELGVPLLGSRISRFKREATEQ